MGGIDHRWQWDWTSVQRLKKDGNGFAYILTVISVRSEYAWVSPLNNKTGPSLVSAFTHLYRRSQAIETTNR